MAAKPNILIVEDNKALLDAWMDDLVDHVTVYWADTLEEGERLFRENWDRISLVVMDSCVRGGQPNSMGLVSKLRALGFHKPIIAKSSHLPFTQGIVAAGADAEHACTDLEIPGKILKILGIKKAD